MRVVVVESFITYSMNSLIINKKSGQELNNQSTQLEYL